MIIKIKIVVSVAMKEKQVYFCHSSMFQSMVSSHLRQRLQQNVEQRSSVDINDVEMQQMLNDERVALFMQNEEFMRELQHNPEFSAALERGRSCSYLKLNF